MLLPWRDVDGILTSLTVAETAKLCELSAGRRVLEVGSAYGYSAIRMASHCPSTFVLAVDPHAGENPDSLAQMRVNLTRHAMADRVSILLGRSENVLPMLAGTGARFGLAFIDGDHSEIAVRRDVTYAWELLVPGGTLACHDYGEDTLPSVRRALDAWSAPGAIWPAPTGPDEIVDTLWIARKG